MECSIESELHETSEKQLEALKSNLFSCHVCERSFLKKIQLMMHLKSHVPKIPFSCDFCQRTFPTESTLKSHLCTHTGEKPFQCPLCQKSFNSKENFKNHLRIHIGEKPFSCDICSRVFSCRSSLNQHFKTHTKKKRFTCKELLNKYLPKKQIKSYLEGTDTYVAPSFNNARKISSQTSNIAKNKICIKECFTEFRAGETSEMPLEAPKSILFTCNICERSFLKKRLLMLHQKSHVPKIPFSCDLCQKTFPTKSLLKSHLRRHTGEKPFQCPLCQTSYYEKGTLKYHIRVRHTGEKPFICDICFKRFASNSQLQGHSQTHEKSFPCKVCLKIFLSNKQLENHLVGTDICVAPSSTDAGDKFLNQFPYITEDKNQNTLISEGSSLSASQEKCVKQKTFFCEVCQKNKCGCPITHARIHRKERLYTCNSCSKSFVREITLTNHMKSHMKGRPKCEICAKDFYEESKLRKHYLSHAGEKNYECNICQKTLAVKYHLERHLQAHKNGK